MKEIWKPIPGYEGLYDASSLGIIRSTPGKTTSNARFANRVWKTRIIKPKMPKASRRHDYRVSLWKNGTSKDYLVARLVCMTWHGIPDDSMTVNHMNGDYLDNRPENLEWLTLADNINHAFRTGLCSSFQIAITLLNEDGDRFEFPSLAKAGVFLGHGNKYVSDRIKKGFKTLYSVSGEVYSFEV
jgi:hypothetical protein